MAVITNRVPDAVWHDFSRRPTWEVMIKALERFLTLVAWAARRADRERIAGTAQATRVILSQIAATISLAKKTKNPSFCVGLALPFVSSEIGSGFESRAILGSPIFGGDGMFSIGSVSGFACLTGEGRY